MDEVPTSAVLAVVVTVIAVPTIAFWIGALSGASTPTLALLAVGAPLVVVLGVGLVLGRRVAASPDEAAVVDDVVAESLGESREELEEFFK